MNFQLLRKLDKYKFVLGSSSPRRKEILSSNIGISDFVVVKSQFEENLPKTGITDVEYVLKTAGHKLGSILGQLTEAPHIVLVADTVVSCSGEIFEKPESPTRQMEMLLRYKEAPVAVITALHICLVEQNEIVKKVSGHEITTLKFDSSLSDETLRDYVDSKEALDAAGGFKYQCTGSLLFTGINGDYFNVVGLPAKMTLRLLEQLLESV